MPAKLPIWLFRRAAGIDLPMPGLPENGIGLFLLLRGERIEQPVGKGEQQQSTGKPWASHDDGPRRSD